VYKFQKFVRRNKLLCAGSCVVVVLLLICLIVTSRLFFHEQRLRNELAVTALQSQGDSLRSAREWNRAAEKYIEALNLQVKHFGVERARASQLLRAGADTLSQAGRSEEAYKLVRKYYVPAQKLLEQQENHEWFYWRGLIMARHRLWREARDDMTLALKHEFELYEIDIHHGLAAVLVADGDIAAYQQLCRNMIANLGGTTTPMFADKVAKDCLILPSSGVDLTAVSALAETAVTRGKGEAPYTFYLCAKALSDYRRGHFAEAMAGTSLILKDPFPYTQAEGLAVLAMAQFRLERTEEARTALARLERVVQGQLPSPETHDLGPDWRDWVIAHALLEEASSLIKGASSTNSDWRARPHE
jgi:tetratricopeptide (TPR) repeat protein